MGYPGKFEGFFPEDWIIIENDIPSKAYKEMKNFPTTSIFEQNL